MFTPETVKLAGNKRRRIKLNGINLKVFNNQMKQVIPHLENTLKETYRKAVDADQRLAQLKQEGHGKFNALLTKSAGFTTSAKAFMPYVEELSHNIADFKESPSEADLALILSKMEKLLITLSQFQSVAK